MGVFFQCFVFAVVLLRLGRAMYRSLEARAPLFQVLTLLSGLLATIGVASFLGGGMFANGFVKVSPLLNWPAGYAHHVVTTDSGDHVVGLENVGRVQVYSPSWGF